MPRLIILLLTLAVLAILTVQNTTPVALVILGSTTLPAIPFGFLLLAAIGLGALLTLFLYGLVGLKRPPESKYQPMGRRVPYPDSPGSTTLPPSGPPTSSPPYGAPPVDTYSAGSSAFVSEPTSSPANDPSPASVPQDTPPSGSTGSGASYSSGDGPFIDLPRRTVSESPVQADSTPSDKSSFFSKETISKKKEEFRNRLGSAFGASTTPPGQSSPDRSTQNRPIGEDWGEARTAAQRNTWVGEDDGEYSDRPYDDPSYDERTYDDRYDNRYATSPGPYADTSSQSQSYPPYEASYDELDQGWEHFNDYDDPPPQRDRPHSDSDADYRPEKRVYQDGLYGYDSEEEGFREDVYDADYRVIVPPSKPLDAPESEAD